MSSVCGRKAILLSTTLFSWDFRCYSAYLAYFSEYLRDHTPNEAFERFILSPLYNFHSDLPAATVQDVKTAGKEGKKHPEMLNRLFGGLVHPFIHLAYGFEFGIPGQVAEGEPGFLIFQCHASVLNRDRPGNDRRPPHRPDGACATLVLLQAS